RSVIAALELAPTAVNDHVGDRVSAFEALRIVPVPLPRVLAYVWLAIPITAELTEKPLLIVGTAVSRYVVKPVNKANALPADPLRDTVPLKRFTAFALLIVPLPSDQTDEIPL